jgi:hypothetical protein
MQSILLNEKRPLPLAQISETQECLDELGSPLVTLGPFTKERSYHGMNTNQSWNILLPRAREKEFISSTKCLTVDLQE